MFNTNLKLVKVNNNKEKVNMSTLKGKVSGSMLLKDMVSLKRQRKRRVRPFFCCKRSWFKVFKRG